MGIEDDRTRETPAEPSCLRADGDSVKTPFPPLRIVDEGGVTPSSRLAVVGELSTAADFRVPEITDPDILEICQFLVEAGFRRDMSGPVAPDDYCFKKEMITVSFVKALFQEDGKEEKWNLVIEKTGVERPPVGKRDTFAKGDLFSAIAFVFDEDTFFAEMKPNEIAELGGVVLWRHIFEIRRSVLACLEMGFTEMDEPYPTTGERAGQGLIFGFRKRINDRVMIVVFGIIREEKNLIFDIDVYNRKNGNDRCELEHFAGRNYRAAMDIIRTQNAEFVDGSR